MKEEAKPVCEFCRWINDDGVCTNYLGKLHGITLTDSLRVAEHDCGVFEEAEFRLTPKGILKAALMLADVSVDSETLTEIWDEFERLMEKHGYLAKG